MTSAWLTAGRVLIGAACGAAIGFALHFLVVQPPYLDETRVSVAFMVIVAALGAAAAGFLSRTGWLMLGGGLAGSIVAGLCGVLLTFHPKGLIYSFLGAPIGAVLVLLRRLEQASKKPPPEASALSARSGVWDDELDAGGIPD